MTQPLICHFLIGLPASGKSTLARKLQEIILDAIIVSTDTARQNLYGDEAIQGDWTNEVEPEVLEQIKNAIALNKPVIYDATNVRRDWRMGMLMKIEEKLKAIDAPQVYWVAWHLQTPVDVCKEWNQKRDRKVSNEVIERFEESLKQFQPHKGEGFIQILEVAIEDAKLDCEIKIGNKRIELLQATNPSLDFSKIQNRKKKYIWHQYSQLSDFERLMHLISLIVRYPGIGNLSKIEPKALKNALQVEELPEFNTKTDEIIAVIEKELYSFSINKNVLQQDLLWLEQNGLIGYKSSDSKINVKQLDESKIY